VEELTRTEVKIRRSIVTEFQEQIVEFISMAQIKLDKSALRHSMKQVLIPRCPRLRR
jgi:hypothetical protein